MLLQLGHVLFPTSSTWLQLWQTFEKLDLLHCVSKHNTAKSSQYKTLLIILMESLNISQMNFPLKNNHGVNKIKIYTLEVYSCICLDSCFNSDFMLLRSHLYLDVLMYVGTSHEVSAYGGFNASITATPRNAWHWRYDRKNWKIFHSHWNKL